jgi:SAM-dependent methyltransferase
MNMRCVVCNHSEGKKHNVVEMMCGQGEVFQYFECDNCECLSLCNSPDNPSIYYQNDYYSFKTVETNELAIRIYWLYLSRIRRIMPWTPFATLKLLRRLDLRKAARFLDVGSGSGSLVAALRRLGYDAQGVDPYIAGDIYDRFGICVRKSTLEEINEQYDILLFSHSLEHMKNDTLKVARDRLKRGGLCIVRMPVVNWAWKRYRTNWIQIDAPRHLVVHSIKSFKLLAERSGFHITETIYDSTELQFWGSRAYRAGISLRNAARPGSVKKALWRAAAIILNMTKLGDQCQYYMRAV